MFPEIPEHRHFLTRDVLRDRNAREFDDATLDGVHEREVAHRPGKECAFGITGATEEERRGGKIHHTVDAELAIDGFETGDPEPSSFAVLFGFLFLFTLEIHLLFAAGLFAIAVVGLVVDGHDVFHAHEVRHDPLDHLTFGFQRLDVLSRAAFQKETSTFGNFDSFAELEGMVVGDDNLRLADVIEHIVWDKLTAGVVAIRVIGLKNTETILNGEAWSDDEEAASELLATGMTHSVDCLPCDQHRHDGGFSRARSEL